MTPELKPTKNQMALLRKIEAGQKLKRTEFAGGRTQYSIDGTNVHMNTAQSLAWNNWIQETSRETRVNPRIRHTAEYGLTIHGRHVLKVEVSW